LAEPPFAAAGLLAPAVLAVAVSTPTGVDGAWPASFAS
jgi:hypothetical protein